MRKPIVAAVSLTLLGAVSIFAQRSLSWDSVAVEARLDAEGRLHVREIQSYVFDGDWNGGERMFRLEPGQELDFRSLARVDPATGEEVPLQRGGLDHVDRYDFTDAKTLRWRSRLPDDPPFRDERITYVLDYTLSNILVRSGDDYVLDHEFLFSDRAGPIDRYTLDLTIEPAWQTDQPHVRREIDGVAGGERALVRMPLVYVGAGSPDARVDRMPVRMALVGGIAAIALLSWVLFARRERRLGRFDPLPAVDEAWIEKNLLPIRAETIGAAWDGSVQQSEVAALLARLVAEGKMETSTFGGEKEPELRMTLKADRAQFSGYERELIDKFFFNGDTTDTAAIREHYEGTGLDPASIITREVTRDATDLMGAKSVSEVGGCLGSILVLVFLGVAIATTPDEREPWGFVTAGVLFVLFLISSSVAAFWQRRSDYGRKQALWMLLPWALMLATVGVLTTAELPLLPELLFAAGVAAAIATTAAVASSKYARPAIEFRRKLAAVREHFKKELASPTPRLDDAWFPYVLAFGLGEEAESWFKSFGGRSSGAGAIAHSSSSSSSGGGSSWTGGGGAFGGAGASGTWVAAATGVAAGVASPSSSSSGGGGGGGGGSSGGGGGGGW